MTQEIEAQESSTYVGIKKARIQAREFSKMRLVHGTAAHRAGLIVAKYGVRIKIERAYYRTGSGSSDGK